MRRIILSIFLLALGLQVHAAGDYLCVGDTNIKLGPFVDETDGDTVLTALTISQADVRKSLNNGNFAQKGDTSACTHDELGVYDCPLSAASDTDTPGQFLLAVNEATASPVWWRGAIHAQAWCDILEGTTALLDNFMAGSPDNGALDGVTNQTTVSLDSGPTNDGAWDDLTIFFIGGTEQCERKIVTYTAIGNGVTLDSACTNLTLATSDLWYVLNGPSALAMQTAQADLDLMTGSDGATLATTQPNVDLLTDIEDLHDAKVLATGTCDSGDLDSCVDATRTEANDHWKGAAIVFQSGSNDNTERCIYDFVAATDSIDFRPNAVASVTTEQYKIIEASGCTGVVAP